MKKVFKIIGITLGVIILLLALSPLFFKNTLEKLVLKTIDKNINAEVAWSDFDLSLFRSFPNAALTIKDFTVINRAPFEGDTLANGNLLKLDMGIMQLFKSSNEPIVIDALLLDEAYINVKVDSLGNTNYDVAIKPDAPITTKEVEADSGFTFDLKKYELKNSKINYLDESSQTYLVLTEVNHDGRGDFSLDNSELETSTSALVSLRIDDIEYLNKNIVSLEAIFQMDLKNEKYTFLENQAKVNDLPLKFNGFVKVNENSQEVDLTFKTPSSDFKNFLAVLPKVYVKDLDGVQTTGDFIVDGKLKGTIDETFIPTMDINISSNNASFKYPDLPKAVQNISIDANLTNETGLLKDTFLKIGGLTFRIDNEIFNASGIIKNISENALVDLALNGTINLAHIEEVLPIEMDQKLTGIINADVTTSFDMQSVENEKYQNIKSNGSASLTGFSYNDEAFNNELEISNAEINFNPGTIKLTQFNASSGKTDIRATGSIQNLISWIMSKEDLKGQFSVASNTLDLNDLLTKEKVGSTNNADSSTAASTKSSMKIPDFLDATISFSAKEIIYDNLILTNAAGSLNIKNEIATLNKVTTNVLGGKVVLSGNVSTQTTVPKFNMNLNLQSLDIAESFAKLELLQFIAPIAKALEGDLNTTISLQGDLNNDLSPILSTLAGNALAQIITAEVNSNSTPILSKLGDQISFLNLDKLSLRDLSTALVFDNGNISVKPFDFYLKGIKVTASGRHGLDKSIDYELDMDVPAKYLGGDVTSLLAKLEPKDAENITVSLPIGLTGTIMNPRVSVDTKSAVSTLTQKLIEKQKKDLIEKGTDILGDLIGGNNAPKDSTNVDPNKPNNTEQNTTEVVKDIIGNIFGRNKKTQDSTKSKN